MKRKLFAFDIDGTLLSTDKQPLDSTREALDILRRQGHLVTIATGRSRFMAQDILLDLDFSNYILCNGAAAFLDHEQYFQNTLDSEEIARFSDQMEQQGIGLACIGLDTVKRTNHHSLNKMTESLSTINYSAPEYSQNFYKENDIYQGLAFYDTSMDRSFEKEFSDFRFIRWHEQSVDIVPGNGSKANTILHLANRVGIDREDIIAFGDGENDQEMLQEVGVGVAMGNALPHIKKMANIVADTNDQDGIWKALKNLDVI